MTLTQDNQQLVTGDTAGSMFLWNLNIEGDNSGGGEGSDRRLMQTLDVHAGHGAITNLVPLTRPLSLFGLTANMQSYEPGDLKPLQRNQLTAEQANEQVLTVTINPINDGSGALKRSKTDDSSDDEDDCLGVEMAEYAEMEYFC